MAQTVYVVMSSAGPQVFTKEADATAYAAKENNLARQRGPHVRDHWHVFAAVEIDAKVVGASA